MVGSTSTGSRAGCPVPPWESCGESRPPGRPAGSERIERGIRRRRSYLVSVLTDSWHSDRPGPVVVEMVQRVGQHLQLLWVQTWRI